MKLHRTDQELYTELMIAKELYIKYLNSESGIFVVSIHVSVGWDGKPILEERIEYRVLSITEMVPAPYKFVNSYHQGNQLVRMEHPDKDKYNYLLQRYAEQTGKGFTHLDVKHFAGGLVRDIEMVPFAPPRIPYYVQVEQDAAGNLYRAADIERGLHTRFKL